MPLLRLNVVDRQITCPEADSCALPNLLTERLRLLRPKDPVVILLHGYRYSPNCRYRDPHRLIFSGRHQVDGPRRIGVSWPSALGFSQGNRHPGLCVPVSWDARGLLRDVYRRAEEVGICLAQLLDLISELDPHRAVHLMAHSLGARVALKAVAETRAPVLRRLILLAPAEFEMQAQLAIGSIGADTLEVLQVSPVENRVFDLLLSRGLGTGQAVGATLGRARVAARNWVRLRIDTAEELTHLKELGFLIGPRTSRICHWSAYLRPGLMSLCSACLSGTGVGSLSSLAR